MRSRGSRLLSGPSDDEGGPRGSRSSRGAILAVFLSLLMVVGPVGMAAGAMGAAPDAGVTERGAGDLLPAAESPASTSGSSDGAAVVSRSAGADATSLERDGTRSGAGSAVRDPVETLLEPVGTAPAVSDTGQCSGEMNGPMTSVQDREIVLNGSVDATDVNDRCEAATVSIPIPVRFVEIQVEGETTRRRGNLDLDLYATLDGRPASPGDSDRETTTSGASAMLRLSTSEIPSEREIGIAVRAYAGDGDYEVTVRYVPGPPEARLEGPAEARPNERIVLDANDSVAPNSSFYGDQETYRWDLTGDGEVDRETTDPVVETDFHETGTHEVSVTVVDRDGYTDTTTHTVAVSGDPVPDLVARLDVLADDPVYVREGVQLTAAQSYSNEVGGGIDRYVWRVDGDRVGEGETITHEFTENGTREVTLEVHDDDVDPENSPAVATTRVEVERPAVYIHEVEQETPIWNPVSLFAGCGPSGLLRVGTVGSESVERVYFNDSGGQTLGVVEDALLDRDSSGELEREGDEWILRRAELDEDSIEKRLLFGDKTIEITAVGTDGTTYTTTYQTDISQIPGWIGTLAGADITREGIEQLSEFALDNTVRAKISGCKFRVELLSQWMWKGGDTGDWGTFDMSLLPDSLLAGGSFVQENVPYMDTGEFGLIAGIEYWPAPHMVRTSLRTEYGNVSFPPGNSRMSIFLEGGMKWDPNGRQGHLWELDEWDVAGGIDGRIDITNLILSAWPGIRGSYPTGPLGRLPYVPGSIDAPWRVFLTGGIGLKAYLDDPDGFAMPDIRNASIGSWGDLGMKIMFGWEDLFDGVIDFNTWGGLEYRIDWMQLRPFDPTIDGALYALFGAAIRGKGDTGLPVIGTVRHTLFYEELDKQLLDWPSPNTALAGGVASRTTAAHSVLDGHSNATTAGGEGNVTSGEAVLASVSGESAEDE